MKKNLILVVGLILVLVMIVSVSALPSWLTGKATDVNSVSIKINKGETKSFSLGGETHEISLVFMNDASVVVLSVDGANTGGLAKGATYESGNLKVKVLTIRYSNNWFSKSKYVTLEVSKVESEIRKSSCAFSVSQGNVCTLYTRVNYMDTEDKVIIKDAQNKEFGLRFRISEDTTNARNEVRIDKYTPNGWQPFCEEKTIKDTCGIGIADLQIREIRYTPSERYLVFDIIAGEIVKIGPMQSSEMPISEPTTPTIETLSITFNEKTDDYFIGSRFFGTENYLLRAKISEDTTNARNEVRIEKKTPNGWTIVCDEQITGDTCAIGNLVLTIGNIVINASANYEAVGLTTASHNALIVFNSANTQGNFQCS